MCFFFYCSEGNDKQPNINSRCIDQPAHADKCIYFKQIHMPTHAAYHFKETKSATMNIFRKIFFFKNGVCKSRIKLCFHNKSDHYG